MARPAGAAPDGWAREEAAMAVLPRLSAQELVLQTLPNDTQDAPWMVMASLHVRDVDLLKAILLLHVQRHHLPWVLDS